MSEKPPRFKVEVILTAAGKPEEGAIWMFYPMARSMYISQHPELYEGQSGMVVPSFEEELRGRFMLVDGCENNLKQGKPVPSPYLADLLRVHQAGYLREYVWWFLGQPSWGGDQQPPNLLSFMAWTRKNLLNHTPETYGGVRIVREESVNETSGQASSPQSDGRRAVDVQSGGGAELSATVAEIGSAVERGNSEEARRLLQVFSNTAQDLEKEADATYVCFQSHRQLDYFLLGHAELKKVRVLDWCVAWGTFLRAFLMSRSQHFAEALGEVEAVVKLAPLFAHGYREKGYILNRLRRSQEALTAYTRSWELATRLPENLGDAGAALRGQAVTLVELGDLGRAEKVLHDSLIVDPDNPIARNELMFIAQRRSGQAPPVNISTTSTFAEQLFTHGLRVHRGRYFGPWPGIGVAFEAKTPASRDISEEGLARVARLGKVTRLSLVGAKLSEGAALRLESLQHLRQLDLNSTNCSDAEVEFIHRLPELRYLNLFNTRITDRALELLAQLPKLEQLFIGFTKVSEAGLSHLSRCPSLRYLDLEGNQITDDTLIVLSNLTGLEGLNIACRGEQISDRGMVAITRLVNLHLLGFVKPSGVSDGIVERVRRMPKMKNMVPSGCAFLYRTHDPFYQASEPLM